SRTPETRRRGVTRKTRDVVFHSRFGSRDLARYRRANSRLFTFIRGQQLFEFVFIRVHSWPIMRRRFYNAGMSTHARFFQLSSPFSASCTPLAPSIKPQRKGSFFTTCRRKSSHCTLKALLNVSCSGTFCQPSR